MNADPHVDLEDLIAEVTGQAIDDRAREHLASCEHCRAEENRWDLVADGVRGLAAATPEVAPPAARPRFIGTPALAGPRQRTILAASAAAALVLIGGASYGMSDALTGHAPGPAGTGATTAALTAVQGCAGLKQADGTLEQVNGSSLVIKMASSQPVTVTTTASTKVSVLGARLSDITDGASVMVAGHGSDGTIAAQNVSLGSQPGRGKVQVPPGIVAVRGTVSDASAGGFTVVTSHGTRVPVTTSSKTSVSIPQASLGQLQAGATTIAVGYVGRDGTLSAKGVLSGRPGKLEVGDCSPASIDAAITTALLSGG
jgi:anti-sigma factor RsiW